MNRTTTKFRRKSGRLAGRGLDESSRPAGDLTPTVVHYKALDRAFNFYNMTLFEGVLPEVMVVMTRRPRVHGHFRPNGWRIPGPDGEPLHELSLNPEDFGRRSIEECLSTLVHEAVHLWQHEYGDKVPRLGYHNREWADMMEFVGLRPTDDGGPDGKRTGQRMTHLIEEGGPFSVSTARLLDTGWDLPVVGVAPGGRKAPSRPKYVCPGCRSAVWGKAGLKIQCGDCESDMPDATVAVER